MSELPFVLVAADTNTKVLHQAIIRAATAAARRLRP